MSYLSTFAYVDLIGRAMRSSARGDFGTAEQHLTDAIGCAPDLPVAHELLGQVHLNRGSYRDALRAFQAEFSIRRKPGSRFLRALARNKDPLEMTPAKIFHDIEQLEYLRALGKIDSTLHAHVERLRAMARSMVKRRLLSGQVQLGGDTVNQLKPILNAAVHMYRPGRLKRPAVNPGLDFGGIERAYFEGGRRVVVIDDFLVPEALTKLRRFCLESTFWYQMKPAGGYLGAYMNDGFSCGLLFQIAEELQVQLPRIYGGAPLRKAWAYKYDSRLEGIPIHADEALVNCNFWLTPDAANLDPKTGGLVVWSAKPPADWSFTDYNGDLRRINAFVKGTAESKQVIPHRQNRMVVFDSQYFHKTDTIRFAPGYENRRINVTLLFGAPRPRAP